MEIAVEKEWAKELKQDEFEREFQRRNPGTDVIPNVEKWLKTPITTYRGISPYMPEDMELEDRPQPKEVKIDYYCRGCKRDFNDKKNPWLGRSAHERHCKALLNKKI